MKLLSLGTNLPPHGAARGKKANSVTGSSVLGQDVDTVQAGVAYDNKHHLAVGGAAHVVAAHDSKNHSGVNGAAYIGNKWAAELGGNLSQALELLEECVKVEKVSKVYRTKAWGFENQPDFLNISAIVETGMSPEEMLEVISAVEKRMGRIRKQKWGPRVIDIDILLWDDLIVDTDVLTIPHRYLAQRDFFLIPTMEIAGDIKEPVTGRRLSELLEDIPDSMRTL